MLPGGLRLACEGRSETPVPSPVKHGWVLIGSRSLMAECSTVGLGRPSLREGCSDGVTSLVRTKKGSMSHPLLVTCRHLTGLRNLWLTSTPKPVRRLLLGVQA